MNHSAFANTTIHATESGQGRRDAQGLFNVQITHRSPVKGSISGVAGLFIAALPWQAAVAEHSLIAAVSVCSRGSVPQTCASDQVSSAGSEIGTQVQSGGDQATALQGYGIFHGSADASIQTMAISGDYAVISGAGGRATDTWVLGGGTGQGYLQFTWSIDGRTATSGSGPGYDSDAWLMVEAYGNSHPPVGSAESGYATTGLVYGGFGSYRS